MNGKQTYGTVARTFHWLGAALILFQIPLGFVMHDQPLGPDKLANYATHKSLGLLLFALVALRLAWRLLRPAPPLPPDTPGWQRFVARATHFVMYALLFLMPVTGLLRSQAANFQVSFFGLFTVPTLVQPDDAFSKGMHEAHEIQALVLTTLVVAHVLAALYHHFLRKDDVLRSMLPLPARRS